MSEQNEDKSKGRLKIPHIYVILLTILLLAFVATFIVPSGQFDREVNENGTEVLIPGTFTEVDKTYLSFFDLMFAVPSGLIAAGEIIFGVLMIGGMFAVLERSGLVDIGVSKLGRTFHDRPVMIIAVLMFPLAF
nr:hypothetical protein [Geomicrobium sp. JCM 19038]